jgi:hypothetical protein
MWEVLTRKLPYNENTAANVALYVVNGARPAVPSTVDDPKYVKIMKRCHANPMK